MKFFLDMGIAPMLAKRLRALGHDAVHAHERNLAEASDTSILTLAREENRVVLTHDLDFPELIAASQARLPSVVLFRLRNMEPDNVERHLLAVLSRYEVVLTKGAIMSVTEAQARIRMLPFGGNSNGTPD